MLELKLIREHRDEVIHGLRVRNIPDSEQLIDKVLALDKEQRSVKNELDNLNARIKNLSSQIGSLMKQGKGADAEALKQEVANSKLKAKEEETKQHRTAEALETLLLSIPNIPHDLVPPGKGEADNKVYKDWEKPLPELGPDAQPHWELASRYEIFSMELGTKLTGSGFPVFIGQGARLERALVNYFLDKAVEAGYREVAPPLLVNADTARATGQLPDKEGQMYHVEKDDLYLIPTAEVPVTNLYRDEIVEPGDLPVKLTGYTPCFRREAGSYGAPVRGLNRVHQFDKVEIVQLAHPDTSYQQLDEMLQHVSQLLDSLELPYRILRLCAGDLGFTSALTYDFEVWAAAQKRWLEVSSVSNFGTYQSNRLKVRFKDPQTNKYRLVHTLNGSALALARIVAALLENNQTPEGIRLPAVLHPYTGFERLSVVAEK